MLQRAADKGAEGHAGNLQRVLEGQEDALFRPLIHRKRCDILAVKQDGAGGDAVRRIAGDGIAQRGFAGAVGPHEHMGLVMPHGQVHAVKDFLFLHPDMQVLNFQKCLTHS